MSNAYCSAPECDRETSEGRTYCDTHWKQVQRTGKTAPIAEKLTPKERFFEAVRRWVESSADDDAEYEANERAAVQAARLLVKNGHGDLVREGMAKARDSGVRLGRPPQLTAAKASAAVKQCGGIRRAAQALGVSRRTIRRALKRGNVHGSTKTLFGPTTSAR